MVLHTLDTQPHTAAFADCIRLAQSGDSVVLLGDAVYAATAGSEPLSSLLDKGIAVHVMRRDCEARGVDVSSDALLIDMEGLVILTEHHLRQLAWY